jgi:hypothetical protein
MKLKQLCLLVACLLGAGGIGLIVATLLMPGDKSTLDSVASILLTWSVFIALGPVLLGDGKGSFFCAKRSFAAKVKKVK